jgi:hypothetical protein
MKRFMLPRIAHCSQGHAQVLGTTEPKNFTAEAAKIAKTRWISSRQQNIRTEIFRPIQPSISALAV